MVKLAFVLLPLIILAIGCTRTKEVIVEQTVIVERTVIVVVTATPEPFLFTRLPPWPGRDWGSPVWKESKLKVCHLSAEICI